MSKARSKDTASCNPRRTSVDHTLENDDLPSIYHRHFSTDPNLARGGVTSHILCQLICGAREKGEGRESGHTLISVKNRMMAGDGRLLRARHIHQYKARGTYRDCSCVGAGISCVVDDVKIQTFRYGLFRAQRAPGHFLRFLLGISDLF